MFCSNCGAGDQVPKAYCKRCGKWIGPRAPEDRMTVMIIFNALSAIFGAASAIALFATYLGKPNALWSVYLAATFCLIISVYQTISFFFALELRLRLKKGHDTSERTLEARGEPAALPAGDDTNYVGVPSVTENTTELLKR